MKFLTFVILVGTQVLHHTVVNGQGLSVIPRRDGVYQQSETSSSYVSDGNVNFRSPWVQYWFQGIPQQAPSTEYNYRLQPRPVPLAPSPPPVQVPVRPPPPPPPPPPVYIPVQYPPSPVYSPPQYVPPPPAPAPQYVPRPPAPQQVAPAGAPIVYQAPPIYIAHPAPAPQYRPVQNYYAPPQQVQPPQPAQTIYYPQTAPQPIAVQYAPAPILPARPPPPAQHPTRIYYVPSQRPTYQTPHRNVISVDGASAQAPYIVCGTNKYHISASNLQDYKCCGSQVYYWPTMECTREPAGSSRLPPTTPRPVIQMTTMEHNPHWKIANGTASLYCDSVQFFFEDAATLANHKCCGSSVYNALFETCVAPDTIVNLPNNVEPLPYNPQPVPAESGATAPLETCDYQHTCCPDSPPIFDPASDYRCCGPNGPYLPNLSECLLTYE